MNRLAATGCILALLCTAGQTTWAAPTAKDALKLKPVQPGIEYDSPQGEALRACTVRSIKKGRLRGWEVIDSNGTVLRRFLDTNGDNKIDQWCYYRTGIEVYRDIDSDFNLKADQYRWLGTAGTRWGIDRNEDGKIDAWRRISAQEVAAEVVAALAAGDRSRLRSILLSADDLEQLGITGKRRREIMSKVDRTKQWIGAAIESGKRIVPLEAKWIHFAAQRPGVVPADGGDIGQDLTVYENGVSIYRVGDDQRELPLGTLIETRHGWRLLELPPVAKDATTRAVAASQNGYFFQVSLTRPPRTMPESTGGLSPALQKALSRLEQIDIELSRTTALGRQAELHRERAALIRKILAQTESRQDKATWYRQLADTLGAAAATGKYQEATGQLAALLAEVRRQQLDDSLIAFVAFRELSARYAQQLQAPKADYAKVQNKWLEDLEQFVTDHPHADDTAEAMMQLAVTTEFNGDEEKAMGWFRRIVKDFPKTGQGEKAAGAIRRIQSVGKRIDIRGKTLDGRPFALSDLRGKMVAVLYFATWGGDMPAVVEQVDRVAKKYRARGFRVVGVSLDQDRAATEAFLRAQKITWPVLYEPGGLDSRLAKELGILTIPTLLLVDADGRLVQHSLHSSQLENEVTKHWK